MVALLVKLSDGGSIFYGHKRIGRGGRIFPCLKFRTMVPKTANACLTAYLAANPEANAEWIATRKLKNDPRVTRVGAVLRKLSLDELPQIINILQGDMSLVGPRPVVRDELEIYGSAAVYYLKSRPGLTGLWQVSGRNDVSYDSSRRVRPPLCRELVAVRRRSHHPQDRACGVDVARFLLTDRNWSAIGPSGPKPIRPKPFGVGRPCIAATGIRQQASSGGWGQNGSETFS